MGTNVALALIVFIAAISGAPDSFFRFLPPDLRLVCYFFLAWVLLLIWNIFWDFLFYKILLRPILPQVSMAHYVQRKYILVWSTTCIATGLLFYFYPLAGMALFFLVFLTSMKFVATVVQERFFSIPPGK